MTGLAHKNLSNVRNSTKEGSSPHTPARATTSAYGSPSSLRADEDCIVLEIGARHCRIGFGGDSAPKAIIKFGPDSHRRAEDLRMWQTGHKLKWMERRLNGDYGEAHELWRIDSSDQDLQLMGRKIERALRVAYTKYLLIDSRPRKFILLLPFEFPLPILGEILNTLFNKFQPPTISLLATPVLATLAAGLRTGLIVDIGWAETVITATYEFRKVQSLRTIRACKALGWETMKLLVHAINPSVDLNSVSLDTLESSAKNVVSFEECEDIIQRLAWCKPSIHGSDSGYGNDRLPSVREEEEVEMLLKDSIDAQNNERELSIHLESTTIPTTLRLPFSAFAEPCENVFFAPDTDPAQADDEEQPIHLLLYQSLLRLPIDIRAACMSRIIFLGGGSNIPGIKHRVLKEVEALIALKSWDPVHGKNTDQLRKDKVIRASQEKQPKIALNSVPQIELNDGNTINNIPPSISDEVQQLDLVGKQIFCEKEKSKRPYVKGVLRAVESMGSWTGASLLYQLKLPAVSTIDRENWQQNGFGGASKFPEGAAPSVQRQSIGPASLRAFAGDRPSWTLGPWA